MAILREMWRVADANGKYPLRKNSQLKRTAKVEVKQARGSSGRFEGYTASSSLILYAEEYAVYLDRGRPARFGKKVPHDALLDFIKNRNLRGRDKKTGKFMEANRFAWILQNAIYKNGIRGRHFIQPAFDLGAELVDIYLNNQLLDAMCFELDRTLTAL